MTAILNPQPNRFTLTDAFALITDFICRPSLFGYANLNIAGMVKRLFRYVLHAVAWIFLYVSPYLLSYRGRTNIHTIFVDTGGALHFVSFLLLIGFTYLNYYLLVPHLYTNKKQVLYFSIVIVCALIVIWFPNVLVTSPGPDQGPPNAGPPPSGPPGKGGPPPDFGIPIFFGMTYTAILFITSTFGSIAIREKQQRQHIEKQKLNAEIAFLKAQINPHFLFNTLNSIYSLALIKSDDTPGAIVQLSNVMRHLLQASRSDTVLLQEELNYIGSYIGLQEKRVGETVNIQSNIAKDTGGHKIAPLLLMAFIENAFKHGVNPDEDSAISIDISIDGHKLSLFVKNNKVGAKNREEFEGIGLENTKERLQYFYPGKHELTIADEDKTFSVILKLNLA